MYIYVYTYIYDSMYTCIYIYIYIHMYIYILLSMYTHGIVDIITDMTTQISWVLERKLGCKGHMHLKKSAPKRKWEIHKTRVLENHHVQTPLWISRHIKNMYEYLCICIDICRYKYIYIYNFIYIKYLLRINDCFSPSPGWIATKQDESHGCSSPRKRVWVKITPKISKVYDKQ